MKIAITGSIGSGKSSVCDYIRQKGFDVFDCDKVNASLLSEGNLGYLEVKKAFPQVFDGQILNKAKLANIVFNDDAERKKLEEILYPLIYQEMKHAQLGKEVFIAEVPLLFEKNWDVYFDISILVVTNEKLALQRLLNRGLDIEDAKNRLKNQYPNEVKIKRATDIIYNNSDLASLYKDVDRIINKYVR